jgi:hypothetical protein
VARLIAALEPDDTVLGGGNVKKLEALPPHCRAGDNANAFRGGFRLWEEATLSRTPGLVPNDAHEGSERMSEMPARSKATRTRCKSKNAVWQALEEHYVTMRGLHLRTLFGDDPARGERMTAEAAGVYLDYSKNRINDETLKLLIELAEQSGRYAGLDSRPSCLTSRGAREGERVTSDESLAPLESIKPDNYPRLSREGLRALKFNWRTANVKDGQRVAACRMPGTV